MLISGRCHCGNISFKLNWEPDTWLTPTEYARFTNLWKQESGRWLLARVISYDHVDGPAPANAR